MLSSTDLERLITEKRREIEVEKSTLGLSPPSAVGAHVQDFENENDKPKEVQLKPRLRFHDERLETNDVESTIKENTRKYQESDTQDEIPAGLERYIRRYLGLPVMLKAGEFSPNNPILREERTSGDALLGLGEYERRRNTLRKIRQQQYREYLDEQAKKKKEEKEHAEKLRRELEEKERLKEEERDRLRQELEKDRDSTEQRRASVCYVDARNKANNVVRSVTEAGVQVNVKHPLSVAVQTDNSHLYALSSPQKCLTTAERELSPRIVGDKRDQRGHWDDRRPDWDQNRDHWNTNDISCIKPPAGGKPEHWDDQRPGYDQNRDHWNTNDIPSIKPPGGGKRDHWVDQRPGCDQNRDHWNTNDIPSIKPPGGGKRDHWDDQRPGCDQNRDHWHTNDIPSIKPPGGGKRDHWDDQRLGCDQNRDHWHTNEHFNEPFRHSGSNRTKLMQPYMPSILDSDAIRLRNLQVEKEAAERRQFYQQELKNQIEEQQRIREERKTREKMLEQAEMRRLEEQLRMLRTARDAEVVRHRDVTHRMREGASDFETRRNGLKREIEQVQEKLRAKTQHTIKRSLPTSRSDNSISKLPFHYPKDESHNKKPAFSTNIPENSIFSPTYDLDSYLRNNLNPSKDVLLSNRLDTRSTAEGSYNYNLDLIGGSMNSRLANNNNNNIVDAKTNEVEPKNGGSNIDSGVYETGDRVDMQLDSKDCNKRILVERAQIHERPKEKVKPIYEPSIKRNLEIERRDDTPIPVLRHSPKVHNTIATEDISENTRLLDDKWKVPVVQKNILKTLPSDEGKSVSILTQLGSIRRQLQLEQMRLDNLKGNK